jgi:hypothetical protein
MIENERKMSENDREMIENERKMIKNDREMTGNDREMIENDREMIKNEREMRTARDSGGPRDCMSRRSPRSRAGEGLKMMGRGRKMNEK